MSDLIRAQQERRPSLTQRTLEAAPTLEQLVVTSPASMPSVTSQYGPSLADEAPETTAAESGADQLFGKVKEHARIATERTQLLEREPAPAEDPQAPRLQSLDDIYADLSLKSELRLGTSSNSFRWLRRLPLGLRSQPNGSVPPRDEILEVILECLPQLLKDPTKEDHAVRWMSSVASCLNWYEVESVTLPTEPPPRSGGMSTEQQKIWRRVDEWEESFRALEVMLRQGSIPAFAIVSKFFTVTVFGEHCGAWTRDTQDKELDKAKPSKSAPIAVMCPSQEDVRRMLQANHVAFDISVAAPMLGRSEHTGRRPELLRRRSSEVSDVGQDLQLVALGDSLASQANPHADNLQDFALLRRQKVKVCTEEDRLVADPATKTAPLLFDGAGRVHALMDVLRQHFLDQPLREGSSSPATLPTLISPSPFGRAACCSADVLSTVTTMGQAMVAGTTTSTGTKRHSAELAGRFFPCQIRRLLHLMQVALADFECTVTPDDNTMGINAFTCLGLRRIENVTCDRVQEGVNQTWSWRFQLGA